MTSPTAVIFNETPVYMKRRLKLVHSSIETFKQKPSWVHLLGLKPWFKTKAENRNAKKKKKTLEVVDQLQPKAESDMLLLERYMKLGDMNAIGKLFQRYHTMVLGTCMKHLADIDASKDASMEVFEKVLQKIPKKLPENFSGWLYVVTKNHCLEILRKKMRRPESISLDGAYYLAGEEIVPRTVYESQDNLRLQLKSAIYQLPDNQRICIEQFFLKELSYKQIAASSTFSLKEVKSHIQNGKRRLGILLAPHKAVYQSMNERGANF